MMYRSRMMAGILLAVVLAGGLGLAVAQIFPSGPGSLTTVSTVTSTQVSSTVTATTSTTSTTTGTITMSTTATTTETYVSTSTSETVTSLSSATSVSSTTTMSSTSACGAPQYCGELTASSPALEAANSTSGYSALTFTLNNAGNLNLTVIVITLSGQHVATLLGVEPAQTVTYFVQLSPGIVITTGQTYQVEVTSSTFYGSGPTISFSVTAAQ